MYNMSLLLINLSHMHKGKLSHIHHSINMFNESNIVNDKESSLLIFHYYDDAIIAPSLILSLFLSCASSYSNIHYYMCISTTSIKSRSNHHEYKSQDCIHHYHHNSRYEKFSTYLFIISTRVLLVSSCPTYWLQELHRVVYICIFDLLNSHKTPISLSYH